MRQGLPGPPGSRGKRQGVTGGILYIDWKLFCKRACPRFSGRHRIRAPVPGADKVRRTRGAAMPAGVRASPAGSRKSAAGGHWVSWDGRDDRGGLFPRVYLPRVQVVTGEGDFERLQRLAVAY